MEAERVVFIFVVSLAWTSVKGIDDEATGKIGSFNQEYPQGYNWWTLHSGDVKLHALLLDARLPDSVAWLLQQQVVYVSTYIHPNLYIVVAPSSAILTMDADPHVISCFVWGGSVAVAQSIQTAVFGDPSENLACEGPSKGESRFPLRPGYRTWDAFSDWAIDHAGRIVVEVVLPQVPGIDLAVCVSALQQVIEECRECLVQAPHNQQESPVPILVHLPYQNKRKLSQWICSMSALPFVQWISPYVHVKPGNVETSAPASPGTNATLHELMGIFPFWKAGLSGDGQVIGIGDSGIDVHSCFFHDPDHIVPGPLHRKIIQYRSHADFSDGDGHGTHICGLLAGHSLQKDMHQYDGIAPLAKLSFTDLGLGERDVFVPPEGIYQFFKFDYAVGSRIHSDSWGADTPDYTVLSMAADRFTWEHFDFVPVMAVGNTGSNVGSHTTMSSPASSKNSLTVGATLLGEEKYPVQGGDVILMEVDGMKKVFGRAQFRVLQSNTGPSFQSLVGTRLELTIDSSWDACNTNYDFENIQGRVLLVERGGCYNYEKVLVAQKLGASAVLIYNNETSGSGFRKMGRPGSLEASRTSIPAGSIPKSTARHIFRFREILQWSTIWVRFLGVDFQFGPPHDNIADFSSFGPTEDGRIKPELVAPGDRILSASSAGDEGSFQCKVTPKTGTSMAAPLVAGCVALVRQYFVDGHYPTGAPKAEHKFNPSGALVKAVLINGAAEMHGLTELGLPLEEPPSFRQGWGRIDMENTLPVSSKFSIWISDTRGLHTNERHSYCISIPQLPPRSTAALRSTLAWYDPPANPSMGAKTLINDLDLEAFAPQGSPDWWRGAADIPDRLNNVERATLDAPLSASKYLISVKGHLVPWPVSLSLGQPYALVVSGPLGMRVEACNSCLGCPGA